MAAQGEQQRQMLEGPARAWSIAVMALLCTVLAVVLLRHPGPKPAPAPVPSTEAPAQHPSEPQPQRPDLYRAWPMFQGWPLPQTPHPTGQTDKRCLPAGRACPPSE